MTGTDVGTIAETATRVRGFALARLRGDGGATLVEYGLVISLIVVVTIPAINWIETQSKDEAANQADCVSTRPPPESCQIKSVTTSTTIDVSQSTVPPNPGPNPPPPPPPTGNASWGAGSSQWTDVTKVQWNGKIDISVVEPGSPTATPLDGSVVNATVRLFGDDGALLSQTVAQCVVGAATPPDTPVPGVCTLKTDDVGVGVNHITVHVDSVQSDPATGTLPGDVTFTRPP